MAFLLALRILTPLCSSVSCVVGACVRAQACTHAPISSRARELQLLRAYVRGWCTRAYRFGLPSLGVPFNRLLCHQSSHVCACVCAYVCTLVCVSLALTHAIRLLSAALMCMYVCACVHCHHHDMQSRNKTVLIDFTLYASAVWLSRIVSTSTCTHDIHALPHNLIPSLLLLAQTTYCACAIDFQ